MAYKDFQSTYVLSKLKKIQCFQTSPQSSSSSSTLNTFPRHRRVVECLPSSTTSTFLPPPPALIGEDFSGHGFGIPKVDRRKTVTFFGDVNPIPAGDEVKTPDFFPLPPPLLLSPHTGQEQDEISNQTKTKSEPVDKNSPDFVESRV